MSPPMTASPTPTQPRGIGKKIALISAAVVLNAMSKPQSRLPPEENA